MPAWYLRMSRRERVLGTIVASVVFLLLNLVIWSMLFEVSGRVRAELKQRKATRKEQRIFMKEYALWTQRDQWLKAHQPTLKSPEEASTLLEQVKQTASKYNVQLENPSIGSSDATPLRKSVSAAMDTKSPWKPLVHFLYDLQKPAAFIVFENVTLKIDSSDPTMMTGRYKIAKWFAPAPGSLK